MPADAMRDASTRTLMPPSSRSRIEARVSASASLIRRPASARQATSARYGSGIASASAATWPGV